MMEQERAWDRRLKIQTTGRHDTNSDQYRYPYEPTPYVVLERLADFGLVKKDHVVLDYGCGKGRVEFFLSHQIGARSIGVEYDEEIYSLAMENYKTAGASEAVEFVHCRAENYEVPVEVDHCYFFNPFSEEILRKVMARVLASYYEKPRAIFLYFYYPSDAYIACLMAMDELEFYDEIPCDDLFPGHDARERILIFSLPCREI